MIQEFFSHESIIWQFVVNLSRNASVDLTVELVKYGKAVVFIQHLIGDIHTLFNIGRRHPYVSEIANTSLVFCENLSVPNLSDHSCCFYSHTVIVFSHCIVSKGLRVFDSFLNRKESCQISSSAPVELSSWAFTMEIASDSRLNYFEIAIA